VGAVRSWRLEVTAVVALAALWLLTFTLIFMGLLK